MSSLELDSYDDDESDGFDDVGDIGMPPPRINLIRNGLRRTMRQIIALEVELIEANTELTPEVWISTYAKRFREIVEEFPDYTDFQVKHHLYLNK